MVLRSDCVPIVGVSCRGQRRLRGEALANIDADMDAGLLATWEQVVDSRVGPVDGPMSGECGLGYSTSTGCWEML